MGVLFERSGSVAHIAIDRPEVLNAMDPETYRELDEAFAALDADPGPAGGSGQRSRRPRVLVGR